MAQARQNSKKLKTSFESDGIFQKSKRSAGGNCVEVARCADGTVRVRDSKNKDGAVLVFTHTEWRAFLGGVFDGEFGIE